MEALNKFNKSMVYSIRTPHSELYYIGSTTQPLCKRFVNHKSQYKVYQIGKGHFITSFKILELGDAYIELLEEVNCENRNQLEKREGELIREHKTNCVNKYIPCRTQKEYYFDNIDKKAVYQNAYNLINADKIQKYMKEYRLLNADEMKTYMKEYYFDNADKIKQDNKAYNLINADKIKQYKKEYSLLNADKIKRYRQENKKILNEKRRAKYAEKTLLKDLKTITI